MFGHRLVILLIVTLVLPILFSFGPLRLSPYRLIVLITFFPLLVALLSGRAGKLMTIDYLVFFIALWSVLSIMVNHGFAFGLESGGIFAAELLGGYLIGRVCIRDAASFQKMVKALFAVILCLMPFAAIEAFTDRTPLLQLFNAIGRSFPNYDVGVRLGLHRSQVVFEHPILYGSFCMSCIGLIYYVWHHSFVRRMFGYGAVALATLFSVSTGALAGLLMQTFFIGWEMVLKSIEQRWRFLTILAVLAYVGVDILSNRSPFHVFVDYLTFSSGSGFNRIRIFEFGSAEVARHPFFGIGYHDWERPRWMNPSVDNFWLLHCMRYGLPMGGTMMVVVFMIVRGVSKRSFTSREIWVCQAGFLTAQGGLIFAGATVHFWNALLVWYMCLLGAGMWMITHQEAVREASEDAEAPADAPRYRSLGRETGGSHAPAGSYRTVRLADGGAR